ncbi:hypothetical protein [Mesorhizobium sp. M7A.F.Ca.AU.002.06.1.1]|uniref:hypothetical protein n=1 Tax=Mesorhizobium sp. M7A.F.Ca.AU.002.06.1.1 TaxID=2496674 RepID=UPI001FDF8F71|nr:hypothetical protein [Mesorhizobium sp. M7A.F.Ca.AU.002.06.1.1]
MADEMGIADAHPLQPVGEEEGDLLDDACRSCRFRTMAGQVEADRLDPRPEQRDNLPPHGAIRPEAVDEDHRHRLPGRRGDRRCLDCGWRPLACTVLFVRASGKGGIDVALLDPSARPASRNGGKVEPGRGGKAPGKRAGDRAAARLPDGGRGFVSHKLARIGCRGGCCRRPDRGWLASHRLRVRDRAEHGAHRRFLSLGEEDFGQPAVAVGFDFGRGLGRLDGDDQIAGLDRIAWLHRPGDHQHGFHVFAAGAVDADRMGRHRRRLRHFSVFSAAVRIFSALGSIAVSSGSE